jgi:tetratricopeptide (TPR) repeat protein
MAGAPDFFVSYTSTDRSWAEWIAWQLEAEGYQVVIQAWDFIPARDWAHEMQQATATAERVVVVLSAAYLASAHGEAEWRVFYAQDPSGERGVLLPVRVGLVEPPGLLKTRVYVDLVDKDATTARAELLAAAGGGRAKPAEEPEFPGGRGRPAVSATEKPRFPGELPSVWNVPSHPNPFFTGREPLLTEIHTRLAAPAAARQRVTLTGIGGVGKTQLAVEYAYWKRADYDLVWWVRGEQPTDLIGDYAALAGQPPLTGDLRLGQDMPQEAVVAAVRAWLERHHRWLLIFDNVEEPGVLAELLPRSATGHVLVTSQADTGWEPVATPLPVEVLSATDATSFLLARTQQGGLQAEAAAGTLATTLGGLPLALEQAAAYVTAAGTINLADYAGLFAARASELLQRGQPLGYQHTVATTWSLALRRLQKTKPSAVGLLALAAFLGPEDLPQPLLAAHSDVLPEPLAVVAADPLLLADAVAALRRSSLVRVVADGLFTHRLLQTVVRASLDNRAEQAWAAAAVRLLRAGFPDESDQVANWPECQRLLPHSLAAADHSERLDVEPGVWPWLLSQSAQYLWSRGQYQQALTLNEQALAGYRRTLGDDHPNTLTLMNNLATTRWALGDLQGARDLQEQALATERRVLGDNHPKTLALMNNLAITRQTLGDLQGARALFETSLIGRRQVLGDDHPNTLTSMNNLAEIRRVLGDLQGARDLQEQALAGCRRVLGDDHPNTLSLMNNLGETLVEVGDFERARDRFKQAATDLRRVLGDDHPNTLATMSNLAGTYWNLGDLQEARELLEQVLSGMQRVLGDDHPNTLTLMDNLAVTRHALGDLEGACDLHEQALAGLRRVLGDDHPSILTSMNNLAATRRDLGDLHGAHDLHEQALAGLRRVLGDDHPDTLISIKNLAELRRQLEEL